MTIIAFYSLAILALIIGPAGMYMSYIQFFPVKWLYYHFFIKKPINWSIFIGLVFWSYMIYSQEGSFPYWTIAPMIIAGIGVALIYKMHQSLMFIEVDNPETTTDYSSLPISDERQMALIDYNGVFKAYPLDYVILHHVLNDQFGDKTVSLTYCAHCRTIIPFDVTEIGPLFVGSFKDGNMIVADKKTKTFFQQSSFGSIIGALHPSELKMIPYQVLTWKEVKSLDNKPEIAVVNEEDFAIFKLPLPIPNMWKNIMNSEATPGLSKKNRDKTFPARTRVVGVIDSSIDTKYVYLKEEITKHSIIENTDGNFVLVYSNDGVNAYHSKVKGMKVSLKKEDNILVDKITNTKWNIIGKYIEGEIKEDLVSIALSDEYWFSWKEFHPNCKLIRLS